MIDEERGKMGGTEDQATLPQTERAAGGGEESMESLLAEQERFSEMLAGRKPVWVRVIQVTRDQVLVDVGGKREGVVPLAEFTDTAESDAPAAAKTPPSGKASSPGQPAEKSGAHAGMPASSAGRKPGGSGDVAGKAPTVGQRIPVVLVGRSKKDGVTLLSHRRAKETLSWETVRKAHAEKGRVRGMITMSVKGGFLVDLGGVRAFLPSSLADLRPVRQPEKLVSTGVRCYVIEINESKKQVVLSRKAVLEEEAAKRRAKILEELRVGEIRIGRVVHSGPTGLLVDIGGLEGSVQLSDIAWGQPKPPSDYPRGGKVKVKVLAKPVEEGHARVSLGMKQLSANPADAIKRKHPPKSTVRGKVTETTETGIRIKLDGGAKAFCATHDCVEGHVYKEGEAVTGVVVGVDPNLFQVLLNLRKLDDIKERKRMASYLKAPPPLTLGELLSAATSGEPPEATPPPMHLVKQRPGVADIPAPSERKKTPAASSRHKPAEVRTSSANARPSAAPSPQGERPTPAEDGKKTTPAEPASTPAQAEPSQAKPSQAKPATAPSPDGQRPTAPQIQVERPSSGERKTPSGDNGPMAAA